MKRLKHIAEAALFLPLLWLFAALPLDTASALGGWLGRVAGRFSPRLNHVARVNLRQALPEKSDAEHNAILRGMWEHLGRVAAELPHLSALFSRASFHGLERLAQVPAMYISGHYGQWELCPSVAFRHGIPVVAVYRISNNPIIDRAISRCRAPFVTALLPKGKHGATALGKALRRDMSLALLVDQKMNEGVAVDFFGKPAMTAPAVAQFHLRFGLPIQMARVVRQNGVHFRVELLPPLEFPKSGNKETDALTCLQAIHAVLEQWIREHPEQYFWVHRRYEKPFYEGVTATVPS